VIIQNFLFIQNYLKNANEFKNIKTIINKQYNK